MQLKIYSDFKTMGLFNRIFKGKAESQGNSKNKSSSALFYIAKTLMKDEEIYPLNQLNLNKFYQKCCSNLDGIISSSKYINYYNISSLLEIMLHDIELIIEYNKRLSITKIGYYLVSYYIYNVFAKFKRILVPMPFIDVFEFIIRNILNRLLNSYNIDLIRMLRFRILFIQHNKINIGQLLQYTDSEYNTDCSLDINKSTKEYMVQISLSYGKSQILIIILSRDTKKCSILTLVK